MGTKSKPVRRAAMYTFSVFICYTNLFIKCSSAAKIPLELQEVHIFYDSSTFDKVEKDAKVKYLMPSISNADICYQHICY